MDIKQLKEDRARLENELTLQVRELVSKFRKTTGVSIQSVSVNMARVTTVSDEQEEYVVDHVSCNLAI